MDGADICLPSESSLVAEALETGYSHNALTDGGGQDHIPGQAEAGEASSQSMGIGSLLLAGRPSPFTSRTSHPIVALHFYTLYLSSGLVLRCFTAEAL